MNTGRRCGGSRPQEVEHDQTARDLRVWLSVRGSVRTPELFVNADGAAMTRSGFEYVLDKHVRVAAET